MLRIRRGWRLRDVAIRCGLSPATIGRSEQGSISSIAVLRAHAAVLDLRVEIRVVGRGTDVARLLDEEHAAIVESLATNLMRAGWAVEAEASYSEYGERGRGPCGYFSSVEPCAAGGGEIAAWIGQISSAAK